jgi:hypothetical protein
LSNQTLASVGFHPADVRVFCDRQVVAARIATQNKILAQTPNVGVLPNALGIGHAGPLSNRLETWERIMFGKKSLFIAALVGGSLLAGQYAKANSIDFNFVSVTGSGPDYTYTYDVVLTSNGELPIAGSYSNGPVFGATMYDISGYVPGTELISGFSSTGDFAVSQSLSGGFATGTVLGSGQTDYANMYNVSVAYNAHGNASASFNPSTTLGTMTFESTVPLATGVYYVGSADYSTTTRAAGYAADPTLGPVPLPPEAWAGGLMFGLLAVGQYRKARRRAEVEA